MGPLTRTSALFSAIVADSPKIRCRRQRVCFGFAMIICTVYMAARIVTKLAQKVATVWRLSHLFQRQATTENAGYTIYNGQPRAWLSFENVCGLCTASATERR